MQRFGKLFEPGMIGKLELKNRIVMPAMLTHYAYRDGCVTQQMINYYAERAKGGTGLIIVESTVVQLGSIVPSLGVHIASLGSDARIPEFAELVNAVHRHGAKIAVQLSLGGIWPVSREALLREAISPSANKFVFPDVPPLQITTEEVETLVKSYGEAVLRAKAAGFDAVEIHGHYSYEIAQFMSPLINKRTDRYSDLHRLPLELIESAKAKVGDDFPIIFRFSLSEHVDGGRDLEGSKVLAKRLEEAGVHAINASMGSAYSVGSSLWLIPGMSFPDACFVAYAEELKKVIKIPVIAAGKLSNPWVAEKVLEEGRVDFIAIGRGLVADPEWPKKVAEGRPEDIRPCLFCNEGCVGMARQHRGLQCCVNAMVGKEREYRIEPAIKPKKVLIAGGGPGGMEATRVAALRGHDVTLYEEEERLGGRLIEASAPRYKQDIKRLIEWLSLQINKEGVKVALGKKVTPEIVAEMKPDVAIVATGATPLIPEVPGIEKPIVVTAIRVLLNEVKVGQEVVVVGGGLVGCETACFLADKGKKVTIVEMLPDIATDMESINRAALILNLAQKGAKWLTNMKLWKVTDEGIIAVDKKWAKHAIKAETVVLASGLRPRKQLYEALEGKVPELYLIGDAREPRKILNAVHEGFFIANTI
jgi:2,4-dienoyl-CoA reductase-like NADH-dependent reductase (Old Yellow Enzyme family)/thioredoxin reductase